MEKVPSRLLWCLFKEQLLSAPSLTAAIGCLHDWCGHISQAVTLSWWGDTLSFSVYEPCLLSPLRGKLKWIEIRKGDPLNLQRQGEESTIHQITCCSEDISGVCSPVPSAEKELSKMEYVEAPHTQQSVPDTVCPFIPQYLAGQLLFRQQFFHGSEIITIFPTIWRRLEWVRLLGSPELNSAAHAHTGSREQGEWNRPKSPFKSTSRFPRLVCLSLLCAAIGRARRKDMV